jgi:hypothetical protein
MLVIPVPALEDLAHVPVTGVKNPHPLTPSGRPPAP